MAAVFLKLLNLSISASWLVLAVLVWTFLKMDDKITALQKRVDELEAAQKSTEKLEK